MTRSGPERLKPRKGTSILEFFRRFPDEDACLRHIFSVRWGDHTACPRCGKFGRWIKIKGGKKYQHACRRQISVLENTIFYRSNLSLMAWFYIMLLLCNSSAGIRADFIRRHLGLSSKTVVRAGKRIRLQMAGYDRPDQLGGPGKIVCIDETFVKYALTGPLGKTRKNAVIIIGFSCEGQVISGISASRRHPELIAAINRFVRPGSLLVTDGHAGYRRLSGLGWDHHVLNHTRGDYGCGELSTNPIEGYWGLLKRTLAAYRMINSEYLWLYLAECEFRFNNRAKKESNFDILTSYFVDVSTSSAEKVAPLYDWR